MVDEWNLFARVIRADGSERQVPMGSWNSGLAQRVLESGGRFELPERPKQKSEQKSVKLLGRRVEDQMRVGVLLSFPHLLSEKDLKRIEKLANRLEDGKSLTKTQAAKLDKIYDSIEEVDEDGDWDFGNDGDPGQSLDRFWRKESGRYRLWKPAEESIEWSILAKL
ncbi:MAG: hypothetical protein P1V97_26275 [Planctomycetota bacterium]|nr:hypothetical protein [Planctomycetota bacterium]